MVSRSTLFKSDTFGASNKCPSESDRLIEGQKREYRKAGTNSRWPFYRGVRLIEVSNQERSSIFGTCYLVQLFSEMLLHIFCSLSVIVKKINSCD